jgi:hypothetical protein
MCGRNHNAGRNEIYTAPEARAVGQQNGRLVRELDRRLGSKPALLLGHGHATDPNGWFAGDRDLLFV